MQLATTTNSINPTNPINTPNATAVTLGAKFSFAMAAATAAFVPVSAHASIITNDDDSNLTVLADDTVIGFVENTERGAGEFVYFTDFDFYDFEGLAPGTTPFFFALNALGTVGDESPNFQIDAFSSGAPSFFDFFPLSGAGVTQVEDVVGVGASGSVGVFLDFNGIAEGSSYCVSLVADCTALLMNTPPTGNRVPAPATALLMAGGLLGAGLAGKRRRRAR